MAIQPIKAASERADEKRMDVNLYRCRKTIRSEDGMTVVELLVVFIILGLLTTLGAAALRNFWYARALEAAQDDVVTQLRRLQQRTVAETHPLVYGARFPHGGPSATRRTWGIVRFNGNNLATTADDTCTEIERRSFSAGVEVKPSSSPAEGTSFADDYVTRFCRDRITGAQGSPSNDHFVFFFARGNATAGQVTIVQTATGRTRLACVGGVTGRVSGPAEGQPCP